MVSKTLIGRKQWRLWKCQSAARERRQSLPASKPPRLALESLEPRWLLSGNSIEDAVTVPLVDDFDDDLVLGSFAADDISAERRSYAIGSNVLGSRPPVTEETVDLTESTPVIVGDPTDTPNDGRVTYRDLNFPGDRSDPESTARDFLAANRNTLSIDADPSRLQLIEVKQGLASSYSRFQQVVDGYPVFGSYVSVNQGPDGGVQTMYARHFSNLNLPVERSPKLSLLSAKETALRAASIVAPYAPTQGELVWFVDDDRTATLAWQLETPSIQPLGDFLTLVDSQSGDVLFQENRIAYALGTGDVFLPSPLQTRGTSEGLDDNDDATSPALEAELVTVTLMGLDEGTGLLVGEFVDLASLNSETLPDVDADEPTRVYQYTRDDPRFEQVVIYQAVDSLQRYIHSLGFDDDQGTPNGIRDFPTLAVAHWDQEDNSFYWGFDDAIHFGDGGVDDGEDADVIAHEYGHAIQANQNALWGFSGDMGAMGEGFGDYLAASFYADDGDPDYQALNAACVAEWTGVSFSEEQPPCLRRVDGNKTYPFDLVGKVHDDGEIWSRALWDVRAALGGPTTDQIILEHQFALPGDATMPEAALEMLQADLNINAGANDTALRTSFCDRGILTGEDCVIPTSTGSVLLDADSYQIGDTIAIKLLDLDLVELSTAAVTITSGSGDTETVLLENIGSAIFVGSIQIGLTPTTVENGILEAAPADNITIAYQDADDGSGAAAEATDTAEISTLIDIRGTVWNDEDGDGLRVDPEEGLAGWTVFLDSNGNGELDRPPPIAAIDVPKVIANTSTTVSNMEVLGLTAELLDVDITLNISHAFNSDMEAFLVSPQGTRVQLFGGFDVFGANMFGTIFDDEAEISIQSGAAPYTGRFQPTQPLSAFDGEDPNGTWRLEVDDTVEEDNGFLIGWSLEITTLSDDPIAVSKDDGSYAFENLPAGTYMVALVEEPWWLPTFPDGPSHTVQVAPGRTITGVDFGNRSQFGEISGTLWHDLNGDGTRSGGEPPLADWTLFLDRDEDGELDDDESFALTDSDGFYRFESLQPGDYTVAQVDRIGSLQTLPDGDGTYRISLEPRQVIDTADFGNQSQFGDILGTVWNDLNADGIRDPQEPGIPDWRVFLDQNGNGQLDLPESIESADMPQLITDTVTTTSTITISGMAGPIQDVDVALEILHTYVGDLDATLISPAGTQLLLFSGVGGSGENFSGTILDDEAEGSIVSGQAPFSGRFQPAGLLSTFDGEDPNGIWTLQIDDTFDIDDGFLNGWSLTLDAGESEPVAVTDGSGEYAFQVIGDNTYTVSQVLQPNWIQSFPSGDGNQQIDLPPREILQDVDFGNQYQLGSISGNLWDDLDGNGQRDPQEPGLPERIVYLDINNNGQMDGSPPITSTDVPRPITDYATTLSQITASNVTGQIVDVDVSFSIDHTYDGDLDITLISPAGVHVLLAGQVGGSGANFIGTILDDEAAISISSGSPPFRGRFRPTQPLSRLDGASPNGTWWLEVVDQAGIDEGSLLEWSLTLRTTVEEPTAITDDQGAYLFPDLAEGSYSVGQVLLPGWLQTFPSDGSLAMVELARREIVGDVDFATQIIPAEIRGIKWNDSNGNGARDPGEPPLAGWTLYLDLNENGLSEAGEPTAVTDASGQYRFTDVPPGSYTVAEIPQANWESTAPLPTNTFDLISSESVVAVMVPTDGSLGTLWTGGDEPFDDSAWLRTTPGGPGGVGYDTNFRYGPLLDFDLTDAMYNQQSSVYMRIPFTVSPSSVLTSLTLRMRYDDGFVAYLNGSQVLRRNAPNSPAWNALATNLNSDTAAEVFEPFDLTLALPFLNAGENILAIHGLNAQLNSSDALFEAQLIGVDNPIPTLFLVTDDQQVRALVPSNGLLGLNWTGGDEPLNDSNWRRNAFGSPSGVGYERSSGYESFIGINVQSSMYQRQTSVYVRAAFSVPDPTALTSLTLSMRYDDGFVAYLNGWRVAFDNAPATPIWSSSAPGTRADNVVWTEIDISSSLEHLLPGPNILALHGLNVGSNSSDMLIQSELSASGPPQGDGFWKVDLAPEGLLSGIDFGSQWTGPPSDLNHDGAVNLLELAILRRNFGTAGATAEQGDLDGDAQVTRSDLVLLQRDYGLIYDLSSPWPPAVVGAAQAVTVAASSGESPQSSRIVSSSLRAKTNRADADDRPVRTANGLTRLERIKRAATDIVLTDNQENSTAIGRLLRVRRAHRTVRRDELVSHDPTGF